MYLNNTHRALSGSIRFHVWVVSEIQTLPMFARVTETRLIEDSPSNSDSARRREDLLWKCRHVGKTVPVPRRRSALRRNPTEN